MKVAGRNMKVKHAMILACLMLFICMGLCACGGNTNENENKNENEEAVEKYDMTIHLEVNPVFDMHTDKDGIVKKIDCLNEDAMALYESMNLTAMHYSLAFEQLLIAMQENEFIKENDTLQVHVVMRTEIMEDVEQQIKNIISNFAATSLPLYMELTCNGKNENVANNDFIWCIDIAMESEAVPDIQLYLDENKSIKDIYCRTNEAQQIMDQANVMGTHIKDGLLQILDVGYTLRVFTETNGIVVSVSKEPSAYSLYPELCEWGVDYIYNNSHYFIYEVGADMNGGYSGEATRAGKDSEGRIWRWRDTYQNGTCIVQNGIADDGATDDIYFNLNTGNIEHSKRTFPDGSILEQKNAPDGSRVYYYEKTSDGCELEMTYENGQIKQEKRNDTVVEQVTTYENGIVKSHWTKDENETCELIYDENGKMIEQHQLLPDGTKTSTYYNEKVNPEKVIVEYPNGTGIITYYDECGYVIKEEQF